MATVDISTSTIQMNDKEYDDFLENVFADKEHRKPSKEIQETVKMMNEIKQFKIDGVVIDL